MTTRMERQRVLYSAKTKTSKVIPTSSTRRPLSLPTAFQADGHPAPLALVESDVLTTKRENELLRSVHFSAQAHRPASVADICSDKASNKDVTVWKRESLNKEVISSTPPRSTLKIRNVKTCDVPKHNPCYRGNQKSHRPRSEYVPHVLSTEKTKPHRDIRSDTDLSAINNHVQHSLQNELSRKVTNTSSTTRDRSTERSRNQTDCVTSTTRDRSTERSRKPADCVISTTRDRSTERSRKPADCVTSTTRDRSTERSRKPADCVVSTTRDRSTERSRKPADCVISTTRDRSTERSRKPADCVVSTTRDRSTERSRKPADCVVSTTRDRSTERSRKQTDSVTTVKRNTGSNTQQKAVHKTAPPVAPKPKVYSKLPATNVPATHNKHSNSSLLESSPIVIRKEGHASSKENHVGSAHILYVKDSDNTSKVHSYHKSERECFQSNHNTSSSLAKNSEIQNVRSEFPVKGFRSSALLPESISPLHYLHNENSELPEMYNMSATTTHGPPVASRVNGHYKDQVASSKSNQRKPLATICISSNTPANSTEEINVQYSGFNITSTEIPKSSRHQNDQNILQTTEYTTDKDSTSTTQAEQVHTGEPNYFLVADFKPRWKRNSMRLATQGYTSMSDLTKSLESIRACEGDVSKPTHSQSSNPSVDKFGGRQSKMLTENTCLVGNMSEIYETDSERNEHQKTSNNVSLNIEEAKTLPVHSDTPGASIHNENPLVTMERIGITRLSYRMATAGVPTAWALEGDRRGHSSNSNLSPVTERWDWDIRCDHSNLPAELSTAGENRSRLPGDAPNVQPVSSAPRGSYSETSESSSASQHILESDNKEQNEHLNKIKRWSYLLATTASISDLTLLDDGLDFVDASVPYDRRKSEMRDGVHSATSPTQKSKHVTEFHRGQTKGDSYSSSGRHSSSKRSCSDRNNENYKSTQNTVSDEFKDGGNFSKELRESTPVYGPYIPLDDSSDSGNTSCYYSASSDTSFMTADGDPLSSARLDARQWLPEQPSPHQKHRSPSHLPEDQTSLRRESQTQSSHRPTLKDQKKRSPVLSTDDRTSSKLHSHVQKLSDRPLQDQHSTALPSQGHKEKPQTLSSLDQKQLSANNSEYQEHYRNNTNNNTISSNTNSNSQNTKTPNHSSPVHNVFQCYGCGINDRQSTQTQPYLKVNNSSGTLNVGRNRDIYSTSHRRFPEDLRRTGVAKMSSERNHFIYPASLPGNIPVRIRKFPVDADFLLKDQSSTSGIPSTLSFSSMTSFADDMAWEETPRFPPSLGRPRRKLYAGFDSQPLPMDSFTSDSSSVFSIQSCGSWGASRSAEVESSSRFPGVAPSIRSVSSIAYGSTRSLSEEPDFLADSKHINLYNLYPHFNNSVIEDCLKDSFHGKNFSRESLESFLSDATTIGDNVDHKSDFAKLDKDDSFSNNIQHKNVSIVQSEQRNEASHTDWLNNSCGSVLGNIGAKLNGRIDDNKDLQEISKASSCATTPRPRPLPKGRYLSSKDILELILTSEKTSKKGVGTLERQAQKMYEVILCCNEVEFQPPREYHF